MAAQTYNIAFEGYWRDEKKGGLPEKSGVYCVYSCAHNKAGNTVSLQKLIYIGEAANVRSRIVSHERYSDWKRHLRPGEELCFTSSDIRASDRDRCEAALIYQHKPPENTEFVHTFPFDQTTMILTGTTALLKSRFVV